MGKIGTPRAQQQEASAVEWWDLPLSRKVAHFETLIDALSAAAAAVTERPSFASLMGGRRRRGPRRRRGHQQHLQSSDQRQGNTTTQDWGSLMEEEERKKKRTRRRRGKWAKVDPTQWPFDMKVAHFTDLAQGQRLKHAVEEAWLEEARRRRRNAAAGHGSQRRSTRCSSSTSTSSSDSTAAVPTSTTSTSALGSSSESDAVSEAAEPIVHTTQANVEGDEGEVEAEAQEEEEVQVGSEYVGEVLRRSNEMKKERRKRRNAKMRREREKELSKKNERKKSEQKKNDDGSQNTKKNGDGGARKSTAAKWEETKGRVRREISKLWTTKHVKRGLVRFERHLADREVLGKGNATCHRVWCVRVRVCGALLTSFLAGFAQSVSTGSDGSAAAAL
jgi:hypothetical protein